MPLNKPILSVILPAYNAEKYIDHAIESILNQTFTDFELIIADDGSTDATKEVIESYNDQRILTSHNSQNVGKINTVNRLIDLCRGKYVTIHDADDMSVEDRFEKQLNQYDHNPNLVLVGTNFFTINDSNEMIGKSNLELNSNVLKKRMFIESQFHGPTVIFKREFLDRIKPVYRYFFKDYNEDYDLCFRVSEFGEVTNIQDHLYFYKITKGSLSRTLTPQKKVSTKIVQYLAKQRRSNSGVDDITLNNISGLNEMLDYLTIEYREDHSKIIREQAELDFYNKFYWLAIKNAVKAIRVAPLKFVNYRSLQYIVRKRILGF